MKTIIGFQSQVTLDHLSRGVGAEALHVVLAAAVILSLEETEEGGVGQEPLLLHLQRVGEAHLVVEVLQAEGVLQAEVAPQVEADLQTEAPIQVEVALQVLEAVRLLEVDLQIGVDQKAEEY